LAEKEGSDYISIVEVRIDDERGMCSLIAAKWFVVEYEAKKEENKELIFGGTCAEPGDCKTKEG
jgi:hypothetical protein